MRHKNSFFLIFIFLSICIYFFSEACELKHTYEADIIEQVDSLSEENFEEDLYYTQYGFNDKPDKLLKQASYAFDSYQYKKCLIKIKAYERAEFPYPYFPSPKERLMILAYKAYSKKFLKQYDSAIEYFEEMINILREDNCLSPECKFITYLEHAYCYLLNGDKRTFKKKIEKIFDMDIAPKYDYYVNNGFKIHHQPCFHHHELNNYEKIVFKEISASLLGQDLYAKMEAKGHTPKIYTVSDINEDKEFCRRMCARASYLSAIIIGCIVQKPLAIAATWALGELFIDCETCCTEGWGSKNCCKDIKQAFCQICQQHLLDGL